MNQPEPVASELPSITSLSPWWRRASIAILVSGLIVLLSCMAAYCRAGRRKRNGH